MRFSFAGGKSDRLLKIASEVTIMSQATNATFFHRCVSGLYLLGTCTTCPRVMSFLQYLQDVLEDCQVHLQTVDDRGSESLLERSAVRLEGKKLIL